jgi:hypothetical protein
LLLCLLEIGTYFKVKPGSIGDPDFYLSAKVQQTKLSNGVYAWGLSSSKYIQAAIRNVKDYVAKTGPGLKLAKRAMGPFPTGYIPELYMMPKLNDKDVMFYQSQISFCFGALSWDE